MAVGVRVYADVEVSLGQSPLGHLRGLLDAGILASCGNGAERFAGKQVYRGRVAVGKVIRFPEVAVLVLIG